MQRISLDAFWARYGHEEFGDTDFARALKRLPSTSKEGPWVAGGSVRRLISGLPQESDFDFFFKDQAQFEAFCEDLKGRGARQTAENDFNITFMLPAVSAKPVDQDEFEAAGPELKVQAIRIAFYESLDAVIGSFDFSICQCGYDGSNLHVGQWTLWDVAKKRLVPEQITYGTSTVRRIIKYTRQGFTICGGGIAAILEQVVERPEIIQREVEYID